MVPIEGLKYCFHEVYRADPIPSIFHMSHLTVFLQIVLKQFRSKCLAILYSLADQTKCWHGKFRPKAIS